MPNPILNRKLGGLLVIDPGTLRNQELDLSGVSLAGATDDPITTWADTSGNGRDAGQASATPKPRISGVNANNPNSPTGKLGANFNFGENDNMTGTLPGTPITATRGYTFYAWIFESPFSTTNQVLWDVPLSGQLICADGSSKIGYSDNGGAHASATTFTSGYHHQAWVFYPPNGGTGAMQIYQDGVQIHSSTWNYVQGLAAGYTIGNNSGLTAPFGGIVYNFRVFSEAHPPMVIAGVRRWGQRFWGI